MNNSNKAVRVSGISYGTGCEVSKEGTWVLNKGERVVGDNRDLKKYLLQNSNTGESKMQNDISKDFDNLILKYGFIAVKNYLKSKDKEAPLVLDRNTVIKGMLYIKPIIMADVFVVRSNKQVIKASIKDSYESPVINKEIIASIKIKQSLLN